MGTNQNLNSSHQLQVIVEVFQILLTIAYSLVSLGMGLVLAASFSDRFRMNDCMVVSNLHTPPVDLSVLTFISTFLATFMVLGIIHYEFVKSDLFVKIYAGIYAAFLAFVLFMMLAIYY